ncbi:50S ribosomal protein L29 [bacterium BMS3Abin03]|jgi:large subunit ribosomal protein L29|nr:50S ribosomal protein L29 [bacterium BMS3Abin03]MCG6959479.1 50S ribosomal protein L29 [bacterium BMS3Abin03]
MKAHEIRELKTDEILRRIEEEESNLVDLRFSHQLKELTNTAKMKTVKKDIARMRTILNERDQAEENKEKEEGENA